VERMPAADGDAASADPTMPALAEAEPRASSPPPLAAIPSPMSASWSGTGYRNKAFTGREWDPETGLYYYRARYYDPEVGRFISEDPVQVLDGNSLYAYVPNLPSRGRDPLGLFLPPHHAGAAFAGSMMAGEGVFGALGRAFNAFVADFVDNAQASKNAHRHAMTPEGGSVAVAQAKWKAFIEDGLGRGSARSVGQALHASEDSFCLSHQFGKWDGVNWAFLLKHLPFDAFPGFLDLARASLADAERLTQLREAQTFESLTIEEMSAISREFFW
jgi:RHS repeat-associated protein